MNRLSLIIIAVIISIGQGSEIYSILKSFRTGTPQTTPKPVEIKSTTPKSKVHISDEEFHRFIHVSFS